MCGSTSAQTGIEQQQQQFYSTLTNEYSTVFGEDQSILQNLNSSLTPIINAGPSQQGFSTGEDNDLNTQATEQTAQGAAQAKQALQENEAAQGGGNTYMPSGAESQLQGQIATSAESSLASEKNQINLADYQQGNQNYESALSEEEGVAGQLNPEGFAGETTGAGSAAASTANQIAEDSNSVWTGVMGALGGIGGQLAGGWAKNGFQT